MSSHRRLFLTETGSSLLISEVCGFWFRQFSGSGEYIFQQISTRSHVQIKFGNADLPTFYSMVNETGNRNRILERCKFRFWLVHWIDLRSIEHNYACFRGVLPSQVFDPKWIGSVLQPRGTWSWLVVGFLACNMHPLSHHQVDVTELSIVKRVLTVWWLTSTGLSVCTSTASLSPLLFALSFSVSAAAHGLR